MTSRSLRILSVSAYLLATLFLWIASAANAQTFRGTILGTVTDSSGAAVPGATVTIKNMDTGLTRTVTTSEDGTYSAPEPPIGNYSITCEKSGFKSGVVTGARVEVSSERRVDFTLQPGPLAQKAEVVDEEPPMVESTSNTLGGIVESKVVTSLPVNGRDYQKLIFLLEGTDMNDGHRNDPAINEAGVFGTPATILPVEAIASQPD